MPRKDQRLQDEVKQLKQENASLKRELNKISPENAHGTSWWRKALIVLCIGLAGAILVAGNLLFWAARTVIEEKKYNAVVAPLIQEQAVQNAVAKYTTQQLYQRINIEQLTTEVLPQRAEFIAPALTTQIQRLTEDTLKQILANPRFQTIWNESNAKAHQRLINFIRTNKGDGTINLDDVYQQLASNLNQTKLSFLADRQLPDSIGSVTVVEARWLPTVRAVVNNLDTLRLLAIMLFLILSALAIWLSKNRRKLIIRTGIIFAVMMFVSLVSIRLFASSAVNATSTEYQAAAQVVVDQLSKSFILQTRTLLLLGLLMSFIAWVGGPYKSAKTVRARFKGLLEGHLHRTIWPKENSFTRWVGRRRRVLEGLSVAGIAVVLIIVDLTPRIVIGYTLLLLFIIAVIELCSDPKSR